MMTPDNEMMLRIRAAFQSDGFRHLTMSDIATACDYTRRNLYNYFNNKEEVFRAVVRHQNLDFTARGIAAGRTLIEQNADPLDILSAVLNTKFGIARSELNRSPHVVELNAEAFRLCRNVMIETAADFAEELGRIIDELRDAGKLRLKAAYTSAALAQFLTDAARGVNQALPPVPSDGLAARYRQMCEAILHGTAHQAS